MNISFSGSHFPFLVSLAFPFCQSEFHLFWHHTGQQGENRTTLVFFLGGVSYAEIAALRFLSQMEDSGMEYIIATTKLINGTTWIKSLMDRPEAQSHWVTCEHTWPHQTRHPSENLSCCFNVPVSVLQVFHWCLCWLNSNSFFKGAQWSFLVNSFVYIQCYWPNLGVCIQDAWH